MFKSDGSYTGMERGILLISPNGFDQEVVPTYFSHSIVAALKAFEVMIVLYICRLRNP